MDYLEYFKSMGEFILAVLTLAFIVWFLSTFNKNDDDGFNY